MAFLNYSLILVLRDDQASKIIASLRDQIVDEFGGGTSLQLPAHVTLLRWLGPPSAEFYQKYSHFELGLRLGLRGPTVDIDPGAVWYSVEDNPQLKHFVDQCRQDLILGGKEAVQIEPTRTYHLTLAYHDYPHYRIEAILEWVRRRDLSTALEVHGQSTIICHAERPGSWHMI